MSANKVASMKSFKLVLQICVTDIAGLPVTVSRKLNTHTFKVKRAIYEKNRLRYHTAQYLKQNCSISFLVT